ncbi:MAG: DegT/DnrJ/EryC1/StrS family aminotransferase [Cytophagales bacterium]
MLPIKMVDLETQYLKIKGEIDNSVLKVMENAQFIQGKEVSDFSNAFEELLSTKHVITCANGTDAIQIALMALALPAGSEVLVPAFCYIAAAESVVLLGHKPVFIEADMATFNVDVDKIEASITENTRAIIAVHLFGQACNMLKLMKLAQLYNLFVIEDNAQSIGADYYFPDESVKKLGTIGHIGTTSFFPSKNLGCMGDGGAINTNDGDLALKIKTIANHGQKVKYEHEMIGINSRLDTIQAAILNVKLKYIFEYTLARQKAAAKYDTCLKSIPEIEIPYRFTNSSHVFHQYTIKIKNGKRNELQKYLAQNSIASMVYYPISIHSQVAYSKYYQNQNLDVATKLATEVLSLPMHTELDGEQIDFISEKIVNFFEQ